MHTHNHTQKCIHCHHTHDAGAACVCHEHTHEHTGHTHHAEGACCSCEGHSESSQDEDDLSSLADISFHILKLDCPSCAASVVSAVEAVDSVKAASLKFETAQLYVVLNAGVDKDVAKKDIIQAVRSCGEDVELSDEEAKDLDVQLSWYQQHRDILLMMLSGISLIDGAIAEYAWGISLTSVVFYIMASVFGLIFIMPMAFASLKRGKADMNVLMSIAVIGGIILGFMGDTDVFRDAAIVIFLDQIGEWLEGWSMRKTSNAISDLMKLAPETAHLIEGASTSDVLVSEISVGDIIQILPGERVALDGIITEGVSSLNEAAITGESVSLDKSQGDEVFAGTLNEGGVLSVQVTSLASDSTLSKIVQQVQDAQSKAAPYQSFVNRFAEAYTPFVVAGALVVGVVVPGAMSLMGSLDSAGWMSWVYRALSLLVVACPCALVISTPVSFVSAITCAARKGVLVKGGASLDAASRVQALVIDKTGTLTTGKLSVERFEILDEAEDTREVLLALESLSSHPIARSIAQYLEGQNATAAEISDVSEIAGTGVLGTYKGSEWFVGKAAAHEYFTASEDQIQKIEGAMDEGLSVVVVARDRKAVAFVGIADMARDNAQLAVEALHEAEISPVVMMTGDNARVAQKVARAVGVDSFKAECMPSDKLNFVEELEGKDVRVAMVGDGINDAPALAASSLAITMGSDASDTALEIADVALLNSNLENIAGLIRHSRRTMRVVRENIAFAIGVKLLIFVLIVMGMAGMSAAVFADTGVALLVILNGMRLMISRDFAEV